MPYDDIMLILMWTYLSVLHFAPPALECYAIVSALVAGAIPAAAQAVGAGAPSAAVPAAAGAALAAAQGGTCNMIASKGCSLSNHVV
jgi:hypothetical protein